MTDKPTVGRVVHYYPAEKDVYFRKNWPGPYAATITYVTSDNVVNLMVQPPWHLGTPYGVCDRQQSAGDVEDKAGTWCWPPRV